MMNRAALSLLALASTLTACGSGTTPAKPTAIAAAAARPSSSPTLNTLPPGCDVARFYLSLSFDHADYTYQLGEPMQITEHVKYTGNAFCIYTFHNCHNRVWIIGPDGKEVWSDLPPGAAMCTQQPLVVCDPKAVAAHRRRLRAHPDPNLPPLGISSTPA
jgi:hypothetical protein